MNPMPNDFHPPIREKPWWVAIRNSANFVTLWGTIYAPAKDIVGLLDPKTDRDRAILVHEKTHAWRQQETGMITWHLKYVFSLDFRWTEERIAYEAEFSYLRSRGILSRYYSKEALLKFIAGTGSGYGGMISEGACKTWLDQEFAK